MPFNKIKTTNALVPKPYFGCQSWWQITVQKKELNNQAVLKIFYVGESSKNSRTRFSPSNFTESKNTISTFIFKRGKCTSMS